MKKTNEIGCLTELNNGRITNFVVLIIIIIKIIMPDDDVDVG